MHRMPPAPDSQILFIPFMSKNSTAAFSRVQDKKVGAPACSRLSTEFLGKSRVQLGAPISPRSRPTFWSCTPFSLNFSCFHLVSPGFSCFHFPRYENSNKPTVMRGHFASRTGREEPAQHRQNRKNPVFDP